MARCINCNDNRLKFIRNFVFAEGDTFEVRKIFFCKNCKTEFEVEKFTRTDKLSFVSA